MIFKESVLPSVYPVEEPILFSDNFVEKVACLPVKLATVSFEELKIICKIRIVYV